MLQFFLELYYHTQEGGATRPPLTTIQLLRRQDSDYASSEGSAFSVVVEAFSDLVRRLKKCLVDAVMESVRERTYKYKKEKLVCLFFECAIITDYFCFCFTQRHKHYFVNLRNLCNCHKFCDSPVTMISIGPLFSIQMAQYDSSWQG